MVTVSCVGASETMTKALADLREDVEATRHAWYCIGAGRESVLSDPSRIIAWASAATTSPEITWTLLPLEAYWFCIKKKAGTFTNLPLRQGGFRASGMWP